MSLSLSDTRQPTVTISWLESEDDSQQTDLTEESHPQQPFRVSGFDLDLDFATDSLDDICAKKHLVEYLHAINRGEINE
jgi:hypothetical protein